ncbi:efflux RND transporter periplasmic adaptor subunit [uncultured Desulfobulbus sp.]|uniref:efflux RND transporter periplasmic adaptor subunit n=1 Tax=uncultured Desulfobulbus sp. TaxID=239745 RepID=UPI0029C877B7|nr:efflux RND transporter periplasmic adaptor subunit [uncultured Desulfobulbus sp.]
MKRNGILALVFIVIIGALMAVSTVRKPKPPAATTQQIWKESGVPVETSVVTRGDMYEFVQITGDLSALNSAVASPKISGRLMSISIHEGDRVSKGQVVAVLDQGDALSGLESAQASLESAKARLAQAIANAEVTKTQTHTAIEQAQATLRSTQAKLEVAKKPSRSQERMVAENRVNSAKANLDKAEADYKRNDRLLKRGAISESSFDVVKTQYLVVQSDYKTAVEQLSLIEEGGRQEDISSAQAQVDVAKGQILDANANTSQNTVKQKEILVARAGVLQAQAAVDTARRQLENTYIRSSISGIVSSRTADPGQVVSPGYTLATIVDPGSVYFKAEISEKSLSQITRGQTVTVRIDAIPDLVFHGSVSEIYPSGSTSNRNFSVRISIAGASTKVKPGMSASGEILTGKVRNALLVPKDAVDDQEGTQSVFVVNNDKTVKRRIVSVIRTDRNYAQIGVPAAINVGDAVVTQGRKNVKDGSKIELSGVGASNVAN